MPQLSMHSCREMMGKSDLTFANWLFRSFLTDFREVDDALRTYPVAPEDTPEDTPVEL